MVSIMLEEIGLPYEAHLVDFNKHDQKTGEFLSLNPNGKIPAIIDPDGPGGKPLPLWKSGAILGYLAGKTDRMIPLDPAILGVMDARLAGRQWFMDEYTIADISMLGWVRNLITFYEACELVEFDTFRNVDAWLERGLARPAVQCGLSIPKRG